MRPQSMVPGTGVTWQILDRSTFQDTPIFVILLGFDCNK